jgi:hypothetical protein
MTGQKSAKEGLDAVVEDWKAITDSVGGAEKQLPLYQAAIGYSK